jgi:hypothetical protein
MAVGDAAGGPCRARDYRLFLVERLGHDHYAGLPGDLGTARIVRCSYDGECRRADIALLI